MSQQPELIVNEPYIREEFQTKEAWLKGRRFGIGASDAPVLLGVSQWSSPMALYAEKLGLTEPDAEETEAMEWGLLLEPILADRYTAATGRPLKNPGEWTISRSRRWPFMTATCDRLILGDPRGVAPLQIKTAAGFKAEAWAEEPPLAYQIQVQQEMAVVGAAWGALAVLIGGQRFRYFELERNEPFIQALATSEAWFWDRLNRREPPALDGNPATREVLKRLYPETTGGKVIELPKEAEEWDAARLDAAAQLKTWATTKAEAENKLRGALGDAEAGMLPSGVVYTLKTVEKQGYPVAATSYRELRRKEPKA